MGALGSAKAGGRADKRSVAVGGFGAGDAFRALREADLAVGMAGQAEVAVVGLGAGFIGTFGTRRTFVLADPLGIADGRLEAHRHVGARRAFGDRVDAVAEDAAEGSIALLVGSALLSRRGKAATRKAFET